MPKPALRICFAGAPAFAAAHLTALLEASYEVAAVYTQPDRPAGRGRKLQTSATGSVAQAHGLPLYKPASLRGAEQANMLASLAPDVLIVAAYGLILPASILSVPRYGCVNVHASLLPRWRGAAPVERCLLAGDNVTGISIMHMDEGLDTGAVLHRREVPVAETDDRAELETKLITAGSAALLFSLERLPELLAGAMPQDESKATYAHKLEKTEFLIDWSAKSALIDRQVRAGVGRTPAYAFVRQQRLRILRAAPLALDHAERPGTIIEADKDGMLVACGAGALRVETVQLPGRKPVAVSALLNSPSAPFVPGERLLSAAAG